LKQAKTGNPIQLPLLRDVGEAIVSYLKVRPECELEEIFVTHTSPVSKMSRTGAGYFISTTIQKSGVDNAGRKHGPHSMRFSLASRMLEQGVGIPIISESLGHSGQDVTMNYLRIDVQEISSCMLEVPPIKDDFYEQQNGTFFI
jgi:site-specific recombinase XerD